MRVDYWLAGVENEWMQSVQTNSSYKMNNFWACNEQHGHHSCYTWKFLREKILKVLTIKKKKSSHNKNKDNCELMNLLFFFFSGSWWWTEKPGVLQSLGSQRVGHDWATELNRRAWEVSAGGAPAPAVGSSDESVIN